MLNLPDLKKTRISMSGKGLKLQRNALTSKRGIFAQSILIDTRNYLQKIENQKLSKEEKLYLRKMTLKEVFSVKEQRLFQQLTSSEEQ